jgi:site-specific recombinase XerD
LGPHDLHHTFAKSLLDPAAYGLDRQPLSLPAIQQLLGHADIATTTIYTRVLADDLACMMGMSEAP